MDWEKVEDDLCSLCLVYACGNFSTMCMYICPLGYKLPLCPAYWGEGAFTQVERRTGSVFITRGNTVTAVKDAALHKD